jgi:circadian clock protein KaiB
MPYSLRLFITNQSELSTAAIRNVLSICRGELQGKGVELSIINVHESPALAETFKVMITPTLIKLSPAPELRIVGDLSDRGAVLKALALADGRTGELAAEGY